MSSQVVFFDESLPVFVKAVSREFGAKALEDGLVVRDTSGRLRFVSAEAAPSSDVRTRREARIAGVLGAYGRLDRVLAFRDDPGAALLLGDATSFSVQQDSLRFRLLDRRIVGSAWVDPPREESSGPPMIVFASVKGGVGRSTALAVTASDLARRGKNVLVIDLDLEAPGLGDLLLDDERRPAYGTVDYLVENGLGGVPDQRLSDFSGTSHLTAAGGGRIDVIPAFGRQADSHPENMLPKLSRAMIEDIGVEGTPVPVTAQIANMIERFAARETYDAILLDSRAGLSELAAPAILGLGANVLLFGTAQRQTIRDYCAMFAAFKLLAERDRRAGRRAEWRLLLKAVHAKATLDESTAARHRDELYELFADNLYDADDDQQDNAVTFDIDDEQAPHWPLVIPFTQNLIDFDPVRASGHLSTAFYEQAFRPFLTGVDSIIATGDQSIRGSEREL